MEAITDREGLRAIARQWDALLLSTPHPSPIASYAWFVTQIEENANLRCDGEVRWCCFAAYDGERLVGVMPLVEDGWNLRAQRGPLVRVPGEYYQRSGEPVIDAALTAPVLDALLAAAREWRPGVALEFGGLREGLSNVLPDLARRRGVRTRATAPGKLIAIDGTFESWFGRLGRSHRKNLGRRARRLEDAFPGEVTYRTVEGPEALCLLEDFARLEASGWKGRDGVALLSSPSKHNFYRRLCWRLARRGWLEWHVLEVAGEPIVLDMWIRMGNTLAGLFTTYDERFAQYSPGALRLSRTVEEAFESGSVRFLDMMTANAWTEHWQMQTYRYHRALVATGNPLPLWFDDATSATRTLLRPLGLRGVAQSLRSAFAPQRVGSADSNGGPIKGAHG